MALAALVALAPALCARPAPAKPSAKPSIKQACADSFARVQQHRRAGKLIEARSEAKLCARDVCPAVTLNDCARWATELENEVPSVLVRVLDGAGREIVDAGVTLDGKPFEALRSGLAVELNPGSHVFEIAHGSGPPVRRDIVLYEGQKARLVDFSLEQAPPPAPRRVPPADRLTESPGPPTLVYVLGGVGVAGLVGFGALGLSAHGSYYDLERTCGQSCPEGKVDSVKRRALLADLSLGVGVVALGAAAYFLFRPHDASPPSSSAASFDLLALPGGGGLVARRTF